MFLYFAKCSKARYGFPIGCDLAEIEERSNTFVRMKSSVFAGCVCSVLYVGGAGYGNL